MSSHWLASQPIHLMIGRWIRQSTRGILFRRILGRQAGLSAVFLVVKQVCGNMDGDGPAASGFSLAFKSMRAQATPCNRLT